MTNFPSSIVFSNGPFYIQCAVRRLPAIYPRHKDVSPILLSKDGTWSTRPFPGYVAGPDYSAFHLYFTQSLGIGVGSWIIRLKTNEIAKVMESSGNSFWAKTLSGEDFDFFPGTEAELIVASTDNSLSDVLLIDSFFRRKYCRHKGDIPLVSLEVVWNSSENGIFLFPSPFHSEWSLKTSDNCVVVKY